MPKKTNYGFNQNSVPMVFLRIIYNGKLSLREADQEQYEFANELKNLEKIYKKNFFKMQDNFLKEGKILNAFIGDIFPVKDTAGDVDEEDYEEKTMLQTSSL